MINEQKNAGPADHRNISFTNISADLFSSVAKEKAELIAKGDKNKITQIRKFYDEICMWNEKIQRGKEGKFEECKPFVLMLNAKAAYALGRRHIDEEFRNLLAHCLKEGLHGPKEFQMCKLFMEAVLGFHKELERTRNKDGGNR